MKIVYGVEAARSTVLKRQPLGFEAPPGVRERIASIFGEELTLQQAVERILEEVRTKGDPALFEYTAKLDGVELSRLEVTEEERQAAHRLVDEELVSALELAAERIRSFHEGRVRAGWLDFEEGGLGQVVRPLERVGIYAPGGTAAYPSTVLMTAIPARVAGVGEVILTTPPKAGGVIPPAVLVAVDIAQVDRVFRLGGAQAIAALAFGTQSVPKVDKICGPGGLFVVMAKKMVFGEVAIDGLEGPTETLIVADGTGDPTFCAADLLAQAEHDVEAKAILITTSPSLAERVSQELEVQLARLDRQEIIKESLERNGGLVVVDSLDEALALANEYAPEHLCLMTADNWALVKQVRHAGALFLCSPEAIGDYIAGPSHVLPTGGTARFSSPLGVEDFLKVTSFVALNAQALGKLGPAAARVARIEGLTAHARAIEARLDR